jgi:hypothetical protein
VTVRTDPNVSVSAYAAAVEAILGNSVVEGKDANAVLLMQALIEKEDGSAVPKLQRIARAHRNIANALRTTPVPPQLAANHLTLLRSFDTLGKSVDQIAKYKEDPLGVLGALAVYRPAAAGLATSFEALALEVLKSGEPANENIPGYLIVYIARTPAP